jgi:predicted nucleic acid-binding protein
MILVVDASVAVKWFFQNRDDENDCDLAMTILEGVDAGRIQLLQQPPHFIAEMASVLAREKPEEAEAQDDLFDLLSVECRITQGPEIYIIATDISIRCRHHLFDTLYHAVALQTPDATLITVDEAYYHKAQGIGHIVRLQDYAG